MSFALLLFLAFVVFLGFFVGLNIGNTCTFWFFKTYTEIPAAVLVLIAFGAGIIVAILFMLIAKLRGPSQAELEKREELTKKREAAQAKLEKKTKKLKEKARKAAKDKEEAFSDPIVPTVAPENADNNNNEV